MLVNTTSPRLQEYTRISTLLRATARKYHSTPSYINKTSEYYTEDLKYYTTKATKYYATTNAVLAYYTDASKYYSDYRHFTEAVAY
jgi:hypothetical protein